MPSFANQLETQHTTTSDYCYRFRAANNSWSLDPGQPKLCLTKCNLSSDVTSREFFFIINHFTVRKHRNLPKYKVYQKYKVHPFLVMSGQNSILSDQDGVVVGHMSSPEEKKLLPALNIGCF